MARVTIYLCGGATLNQRFQDPSMAYDEAQRIKALVEEGSDKFIHFIDNVRDAEAKLCFVAPRRIAAILVDESFEG